MVWKTQLPVCIVALKFGVDKETMWQVEGMSWTAPFFAYGYSTAQKML